MATSLMKDSFTGAGISRGNVAVNLGGDDGVIPCAITG
jgi:hypothetical protein